MECVLRKVTLKRLTTTVEEENSRKELLQLYLEREQAASAKRSPGLGSAVKLLTFAKDHNLI